MQALLVQQCQIAPSKETVLVSTAPSSHGSNECPFSQHEGINEVLSVLPTEANEVTQPYAQAAGAHLRHSLSVEH